MKQASCLLAAALIAGATVVPASAQMLNSREQSVKQAGARFAEMDADSNGIVTLEEVSAFLAARAERSGRPASPDRAQAMFAEMDTDKDGKVTLKEATNAAGDRFDAADKNKNGVIDPDEAAGQRRERGGEGGPGRREN